MRHGSRFMRLRQPKDTIRCGSGRAERPFLEAKSRRRRERNVGQWRGGSISRERETVHSLPLHSQYSLPITHIHYPLPVRTFPSLSAQRLDHSAHYPNKFQTVQSAYNEVYFIKGLKMIILGIESVQTNLKLCKLTTKLN